jgi:hypothetical protein
MMLPSGSEHEGYIEHLYVYSSSITLPYCQITASFDDVTSYCVPIPLQAASFNIPCYRRRRSHARKRTASDLLSRA